MKPFMPMTSQNIDAAGTASAATALSKYPHILCIGEGAYTTYIKFGDKNVVATNEDISILSGMALEFSKPDGAEFFSIIAPGGTSRFCIVEGVING